ncbi:unnamed protein product [Phytomonas sp. Hart1]|nr:unnamed protein product [Phytomonas sp. Hart1]|eukprot:CCW66233.1 unnamed protein product [Phytomonas sp. isolate Hart1]
MYTIQIDDLVIQLPSNTCNSFNPSYAFGGHSSGAVIGLRDVHSGVILLPIDPEGDLIVTPGHSYNVILITEKGSKRTYQNDEIVKKHSQSDNIQNTNPKRVAEETHSLVGKSTTLLSQAAPKTTDEGSGAHPITAFTPHIEYSNPAEGNSLSTRKHGHQHRRLKINFTAPSPVEPFPHTKTATSMAAEVTKRTKPGDGPQHGKNSANTPSHHDTAKRLPSPPSNAGKMTKANPMKEDLPISVTFSGEENGVVREEIRPLMPAPRKRDRILQESHSSSAAEVEDLSNIADRSQLHPNDKSATGKKKKDLDSLLQLVHTPPVMPIAVPKTSKHNKSEKDGMSLIEQFATLNEPRVSPPRSNHRSPTKTNRKGENTAENSPPEKSKSKSGKQPPQISLPNVVGGEVNVTKRRRRAPLDISTSSDSD